MTKPETRNPKKCLNASMTKLDIYLPAQIYTYVKTSADRSAEGKQKSVRKTGNRDQLGEDGERENTDFEFQTNGI